MELTCMVVEDDPMSMEIIRQFVDKTEGLSLVAELENAKDAIQRLKEERVDILILDVNLPEMSGLDMLKELSKEFEVIVVTGDKDHAPQAFDVNVTDFVLKPLNYERFSTAVGKAVEKIRMQQKINEKQKDIYVKSDSKFIRIDFHDLFFVEALADYVIFNTTHGKYIVHYTMKGIEKRLPVSLFSRVHRSYIVNTEKVELLEDTNLIIHKKTIPIGASYKERFLKRLNFL